MLVAVKRLLFGNSLKTEVFQKISDSYLIVKKKRVLGIKAGQAGLEFDRPELAVRFQ
jgi:hypothetical protein